MLYLMLSSLVTGGRADVFPWWGVGYALLALHHLARVYQVCNVGSVVSGELERVLTMLSQFAFIHGNNDLLCFAMARR